MTPEELQLPVVFNVRAVFFFALIMGCHLPGLPAAICATVATAIFRILAIIFNWKTRAVEGTLESR